jgi:hypothetical protein
MKHLFLTLLTLFSAQSFAQEIVEADETLSSNIIGAWEHISSTYPNGDVSRYRKEFEFFAGGIGVCTEYYDQDTVLASFSWEVLDSSIYVFTEDDRGHKVNTDSQFISSIDELNLFLNKIFGPAEFRKETHYRKKTGDIVQH